MSAKEEAFQEAPWWYNWLISTAMMLIFAAYLGMQSYLTSTIDGQAAYDSLTIVFALFGLGNFGAAACIEFFGMWWALVLGGWSHVFLITAAALAVTDSSLTWLLYPGGFICGAGAGFLLWAGHGAYVSKLVPPERLGDAFGLFWSIFGFNEVLVFPIILLMNLVVGYDPKVFFWMLVALGCAGCTLMMCVKEWPPAPKKKGKNKKQDKEHRAVADSSGGSSDAPGKLSKLDLVKKTFQMFGDRKALCILPMCLLSGCLEGFYFTILPTFVDPKIIIPIGFTGHGLAVMAGSKFIGKMADKYGVVPVVHTLMVPALAGVVCSIVIIQGYGEQGTRDALFIFAETVSFGLIDFPMQGLLRMLITKLYDKEGLVEVGMGWMLVAVAMGLTWNTITSTRLPFLIQPFIIGTLAVFTAIGIKFLPADIVAGARANNSKGNSGEDDAAGESSVALLARRPSAHTFDHLSASVNTTTPTTSKAQVVPAPNAVAASTPKKLAPIENAPIPAAS